MTKLVVSERMQCHTWEAKHGRKQIALLRLLISQFINQPVHQSVSRFINQFDSGVGVVVVVVIVVVVICVCTRARVCV